MRANIIKVLKKPIALVILGSAVSLFLTMSFYGKASANHVPINYGITPASSCTSRMVSTSATSPADAVGSGYIYRTDEVFVNLDPSLKGFTFQSNCTLTGVPGNTAPVLELYGLHADQVWLGPEVPGGYTANRRPDNCAFIPPTNPGIGQCSYSVNANNNWEVFQDDATYIMFNGSRIYCNGMRDECGNDVYRNGVEGDGSCPGVTCPISGAGFADIPPVLLYNASGSTVPDIPLSMVVRNTYAGGHSVVLTLTTRYKQKAASMTITPKCSTKNAHVQVNPSSPTATISYRVDGGPVTTVSSSDFYIDMSPYNQTVNHNITATGNVGATPVSGSAVYDVGPCTSGGGGGCPSEPSPPNHTVPLPDISPTDNGPPTGPSGSPNATYTQTVRQNRTNATATDDISNSVPVNNGSPSPPVGSPLFRLPVVSQSYQSATISYQPFIDSYPYDFNQANVNYDSFYSEYTWRSASSPSYYTCDPGDSLSGSTCTHTYTVTVCNPGAWGDWDGNPKTPPTFNSCPGTHSETRTSTYSATPWYNYSRISGPTTRTTPGVQNGPVMRPCYDRDFDLTHISPNQVDWSPSAEDPNQVTFGSTFHYVFDTTLDGGGPNVRSSLKVKTNVTGNYYIKRGGVTVGPYPISSRCPATNNAYSTSPTGITVNSGNYIRTVSGDQLNTDCFGASLPPIQLGDQACFTITTDASAGHMDPSGDITSVSAGGRTSPEKCSQPIQNQPYVRVYSNDVFAGGGFAGSTCSNVAPIYGYQHPGTARGSSTQLAAFALGVISGFSSAQIKNPTTSLTFANTPGLGNFGGTQCIPDFYGAKPTATTAVTSPVDPSGFDGAYEYSGSDLTIDSGSPPIKIPPSRRIAIFASGNVYIRKDVQFNGAVPWTSQSEVPAFYVIAKGNIYIDPSVTQLSGVFVSQGGTIYTCASHAPPYTSAELYNSCTNGPAKQLTVFGSLVGQGIKLQRAYSSMRHSTDNESPVGPAHSCDIVGGSGVDPFQVCSAEWIIFDPSIYLSQPPFRSDPDLRFDAVTSLPPIL